MYAYNFLNKRITNRVEIPLNRISNFGVDNRMKSVANTQTVVIAECTAIACLLTDKPVIEHSTLWVIYSYYNRLGCKFEF